MALAACAGPAPAPASHGLAQPASYVPMTQSPPLAPQVATPVSPAAVNPSAPGSFTDLAKGASHFEGLDQKDILATLGKPSFLRREAPAEVWQYYGPGCILDLFIYEDNGARRVVHAELRGRSSGEAAEPACLSHLIDGRRGQKAS